MIGYIGSLIWLRMLQIFPKVDYRLIQRLYVGLVVDWNRIYMITAGGLTPIRLDTLRADLFLLCYDTR